MIVTAYPGDHSGEGRETRDGWQENRKPFTYRDEVLDVLQDAFPGITWARFGQGFAFTKNRVAL